MHWSHCWQLRTTILTITLWILNKEWRGQHLQFLRCLEQSNDAIGYSPQLPGFFLSCPSLPCAICIFIRVEWKKWKLQLSKILGSFWTMASPHFSFAKLGLLFYNWTPLRGYFYFFHSTLIFMFICICTGSSLQLYVYM